MIKQVVNHSITEACTSNMSKVPSSLKENLSFLKLLQETKSNEQRQALLETATPSQIRALAEICQHTLSGYCKLDKKTRKSLRSKTRILQKIASPTRTYQRKKERIGQFGGNFF